MSKVTKPESRDEDDQPSGFLELEVRRGLITALATGPKAFDELASAWDHHDRRGDQPPLIAQALHAICMEVMALSIRCEEELDEIKAVQKALAGLVSGVMFGDKEGEFPPEDASFEDRFFAAARWHGAKIAAGAGLPLRPAS